MVSTACRPGGIDVTLAGMRDQTFQDFEVILVDRRYERRHTEVVELANNWGVPVLHVPEHRRNGKWVSFASAWNTGFALARGRTVIILVDYAYAPPKWIENHLEALGEGLRYVVAPYHVLPLPDLEPKCDYDFIGVYREWKKSFSCSEENAVGRGEVLDEMRVFRKGWFDPSWLSELLSKQAEGELGVDDRIKAWSQVRDAGLPEGWVHIKNESIARDFLWELNGVDERLERGRGPIDIDFQWRLVTGGAEMVWCPKATVFYLDPHVLLPALPFGSTLERVSGRWSWRDGLSYVSHRRAEMSFGRSPAAKNSYTLKQLSERLSSWRDGDVPVPRDVSDMEYWGRELLPESI